MGFLSKLATGGQRKKYADYDAGALAASLGFTLASGDPMFNFVIDPGHDANDAASSRVGRRVERDIRLEGQWQGRPAEIVWALSAKKHFGVLQNTIRTNIDARMSVTAAAAVEPFEVINKTSVGVLHPEPWLEFPGRAFGAPELDASFEARCEDPALAPALVPGVRTLAPTQWIHVVGGETLVSLVMTHYSVMGAAMQAPVILDGLAQMASAAEQRRERPAMTPGMIDRRLSVSQVAIGIGLIAAGPAIYWVQFVSDVFVRTAGSTSTRTIYLWLVLGIGVAPLIGIGLLVTAYSRVCSTCRQAPNDRQIPVRAEVVPGIAIALAMNDARGAVDLAHQGAMTMVPGSSPGGTVDFEICPQCRQVGTVTLSGANGQKLPRLPVAGEELARLVGATVRSSASG